MLLNREICMKLNSSIWAAISDPDMFPGCLFWCTLILTALFPEHDICMYTHIYTHYVEDFAITPYLNTGTHILQAVFTVVYVR